MWHISQLRAGSRTRNRSRITHLIPSDNIIVGLLVSHFNLMGGESNLIDGIQCDLSRIRLFRQPPCRIGLSNRRVQRQAGGRWSLASVTTQSITITAVAVAVAFFEASVCNHTASVRRSVATFQRDILSPNGRQTALATRGHPVPSRRIKPHSL